MDGGYVGHVKRTCEADGRSGWSKRMVGAEGRSGGSDMTTAIHYNL